MKLALAAFAAAALLSASTATASDYPTSTDQARRHSWSASVDFAAQDLAPQAVTSTDQARALAAQHPDRACACARADASESPTSSDQARALSAEATEHSKCLAMM